MSAPSLFRRGAGTASVTAFPTPNVQEAPMVSDVAVGFTAAATRDRAVRRTGSGTTHGAPAENAGSSPLALLLT